MPLGDIRQLPFAVLTCRSRASSTHTTIDHASVALPVAVCRIVVRVSVSRASTWLKKVGSRSVRNTLFGVVANRAGTLVTAGVAVVEELLRRVSVYGSGKGLLETK